MFQAGFGKNLWNTAFREDTCRKASTSAMLIFPLDILEIKKETFIKLLSCLGKMNYTAFQ